MSLFHTIKPSDIWPGDHLYIWSSPLHQHHGIVIFVAAKNPADSKVLEFNTHDGSRTKSHARIQVVTLEQFRRNRVLKRAVYGSQWARWKKAGTAYLTESLAPENVVDNAQLILEQIKFGGDLLVPNDPETLWSDADGHGYSLILRNCECLAYWCKTGRWYSEQVMQMVENVSKYILALIKGFFDYLVRAKFIPPIGQEAFSGLIERMMPTCGAKFCTLLSDGIGNAIAFLVIETVKLAFRIYQLYHGQMTRQEFFDKTLASVIKGLCVGVFAFLIQALLTYLTFGTALAVPWVGGFVGSLIGATVGDFLGRVVVNGVAQLQHQMFAE